MSPSLPHSTFTLAWVSIAPVPLTPVTITAMSGYRACSMRVLITSTIVNTLRVTRKLAEEAENLAPRKKVLTFNGKIPTTIIAANTVKMRGGKAQRDGQLLRCLFLRLITKVSNYF